MDMFEGSRDQAATAGLFEDLVRPREALLRFSSIRAIVTDAPEAKLAALFDHCVEHAFATPEYHEALIERAVRGVLRREGVVQRFRPAKLGLDRTPLVTPLSKSGLKDMNGVRVEFMPSSLHCYTIARNMLERGQNRTDHAL